MPGLLGPKRHEKMNTWTARIGAPRSISSDFGFRLGLSSGVCTMCGSRKGGRAVECTGLENRQGLTVLVGSNPTPSAKLVTGLL